LKSPGGKRSGPAGSGPSGCPVMQMRGRDGCESCLFRAASTFGAGVCLRCPVHPDGTASVGSMDGRGAGTGPGRREASCLFLAAGRSVGRRLWGRGARRSAPLSRGRGVDVPVALERVGAGNPAPIFSGLPRMFLNPSGIRDAGTAAPRTNLLCSSCHANGTAR